MWSLQISQVVREFDGQLLAATDSGVAATAVAEILEHSRCRQRAWMRRHVPGSASCVAWRPVKMFRRAAEKWIKAIDHQLQLAGLPGLSLFEVSGEQEAPQHWSRWRHLSIGMDMGSDGLVQAFLHSTTFFWCAGGH